MTHGRIVILTALDLEYAAVRALLTDVQARPHPAGTRFEVGRLSRSGGEVAMALVGKGNHPAAVLAERAIAEFAPEAVLFIGVAGALRPDISLGDVVVATHVYAYHGGISQDDGLKGRPRVWEVSHGPDQTARHIARDAEWTRHLPGGGVRPKVHFGPIAAGEIVQDSNISEYARWIREHYNDAAAIEMEAAGVAQAGHLNNSVPVIVVRGISDRADGGKTTSDQAGWQQRSAAHAAAFGIALAEELVISLGSKASRAREAGKAAERDGSFTNVARGNARVGVQAGQIFGGVQIGPEHGPPADVADQIADFRGRLNQAYRAGQLDEFLKQAADAELDMAEEALVAPAAQKRGRLMVALKRLHGLIDDVADLAAKVAVIIAAVKGMP